MLIKKYNLPDQDLFLDKQSNQLLVYVPRRLMVVLGNGSQAEKELKWEQISSDHVPVYQRKSGGCSVVLSPRMLVIAFSFSQSAMQGPAAYFRLFNQLIINALSAQGIDQIRERGISDLAVNDLKISGSAIFLKKQKVFFHTVINLAEKIETINHYLKHPPREPDYRQGRDHKDFITSLAAQGMSVNVDRFQQDLQAGWIKFLKANQYTMPEEH